MAMVESDYIVASPSTFAITAGILGTAKVVHNQNWVASKAGAGEEFWRQIRDNELLGYEVLGLVED